MKDRILEEMKKTFNPELINRIDETIIFHSLDRDHIMKIIDILAKSLVKRLKERNIDIILTPEGREFITDKGWDPNFGEFRRPSVEASPAEISGGSVGGGNSQGRIYK